MRNGCAVNQSDCSKSYPGTDADCHCEVDGASVYVVPSGAAWPAEAQTIIDAAGARA